MAIFSFNRDQNTFVDNNAACLNTVGIEPANFAFITLNGEPHAPPGPLDLTLGSFTPNPTTDLFMGAGDRLNVSIHDSTDGLVTEIRDLTTGQTGSMTASAENGFAQVNYEPDRRHVHPDAVLVPPDVLDVERAHPRAVGGALLQRRLLRRDRALRVLRPGERARDVCVNPGVTEQKKDADDTQCFNADASLRIADRRLHRDRQRLRRGLVPEHVAGIAVGSAAGCRARIRRRYGSRVPRSTAV